LLLQATDGTKFQVYSSLRGACDEAISVLMMGYGKIAALRSQ
jgi:hypothetical protein